MLWCWSLFRDYSHRRCFQQHLNGESISSLTYEKGHAPCAFSRIGTAHILGHIKENVCRAVLSRTRIWLWEQQAYVHESEWREKALHGEMSLVAKRRVATSRRATLSEKNSLLVRCVGEKEDASLRFDSFENAYILYEYIERCSTLTSIVMWPLWLIWSDPPRRFFESIWTFVCILVCCLLLCFRWIWFYLQTRIRVEFTRINGWKWLKKKYNITITIFSVLNSRLKINGSNRT